LKKSHRILGFTQSKWLEEYISFNTMKRIEAKSKILRDLFKIFNLSVFGKTMENKRKRVNVKIVNNAKKAEELICLPNCETFHRLGKELCTFLMKNRMVYLDRPIYCGFTVLELSKLSMYRFHYDQIRKWYGNRAKLILTDTDSLYYSIETEDLYKDMKRHLDVFDTSEYPEDHPLYSSANKLKLGYMKDDANGKIVEEIIGLCPKSYSIIGCDFKKAGAKGVPKSIKENLLSHQMYGRILRNQLRFYCTGTQIRSRNHQLTNSSFERSALHGFDSKRYIRDDGVRTYAWNHYKIQE
jgi:hypothetical protein